MFTFNLEDFPKEVVEDLTRIADTAMAVGRVLRDPSDDRSSPVIVSHIEGEPFASATEAMVGRILLHHQTEG